MRNKLSRIIFSIRKKAKNLVLRCQVNTEQASVEYSNTDDYTSIFFKNLFAMFVNLLNFYDARRLACQILWNLQ